MRLIDRRALLKKLEGKKVDFYLEDDMFEIEGLADSVNGKTVIRVLDAVGHVLEMCGDCLEVQVTERRLYARRPDTGKIFEMEINRIYESLEEPVPGEFLNMKASGADQFFKKNTDTLIWFDDEDQKWIIELNKINMYFSGNRTSYESLDQLFEENREHMGGSWQAVSYSSAVEDEEVYGKDCC